MVPVAGVDSCKGGWVVATESQAFVRSDFVEVLAELPDDALIAVDMPIGLLDEYVERGREADKAARAMLRGKESSVFSAPARPALRHPDDYAASKEAMDDHLPAQTFGLVPKLVEVDKAVRLLGQERIREVHPELSFFGLNGDRPVLSKKREPRGAAERRSLLRHAGISIPQRRPRGAAEHDLLDACAALWSARRILDGYAERVPDDPPVDSCGLRMEMWW